jgi:predicted small secreted protein
MTFPFVALSAVVCASVLAACQTNAGRDVALSR